LINNPKWIVLSILAIDISKNNKILAFLEESDFWHNLPNLALSGNLDSDLR